MHDFGTNEKNKSSGYSGHIGDMEQHHDEVVKQTSDYSTDHGNEPEVTENLLPGVQAANEGVKTELHIHITDDDGVERETWDQKLDFMLAAIGFAVDLGNVVRFPYICYRNGGGAFLIPYVVMLLFGGLPLFFMELALGQFQNCGCLSVWRRICPMFKGIGYGIFFIASYVAMYYNTMIAWALYYLIGSFAGEVPWKGCNHEWNTPNCTSSTDMMMGENLVKVINNYSVSDLSNLTESGGSLYYTNYTYVSNRIDALPGHSDAEEYFYRSVLEIHKSEGLGMIGSVKWEITGCLLVIFAIVYFALWKGIKSSGKAVWITATLPYIVLSILLVKGITLPGSWEGIKYYLKPDVSRLSDFDVWKDAAGQIFFSLGPGFGVLLALSSYNKYHNNCHRDAIVIASINCFTSFISGIVVFSTLGYMADRRRMGVGEVADQNAGPGLVFIAYPQAIATMDFNVFFAVIFFLMMITLGIDSTFGGLEAMITAICDEWPRLGRHRELVVLIVLAYCFLGALSTTTYGGAYVVTLMDTYGVPVSILFIVFLEAVAVCWFYGVDRFSRDIESMIGHPPGIFWRLCWTYISPFFLLALFIVSAVNISKLPVAHDNTELPDWVFPIGIAMTSSSVLCVPAYILYRLLKVPAGKIEDKVLWLVEPEEVPIHMGSAPTTAVAITERDQSKNKLCEA